MTHSFPRKHMFAAAAIGLTLVPILALSPSSNVNATRTPIQIELPIYSNHNNANIINEAIDQQLSNPIPDVRADNRNQEQPSLIDEQESASQDIQETNKLHQEKEEWKTFTIKSGDTLSDLFKKAGYDDKVMYTILHDQAENKALSKIYPREKIAFLSKENNELAQVKLIRSPLESVLFAKNEAGKFSLSSITRDPDVHVAYSEGIINSSLFLAGQKAGMTESQIMELANIFGWDIDFILDIREGDKFNLIFEELYLDGEKYKNGRILAANFTNQGNQYSAVLYTDEHGDSNYFTPKGESMRKAFIRTPVDFARISSHFNLKRFHPVLHKIRAHKGTDYAAAYGTPIKATGDGKVITAGNKGGYGRTVVIQHGNDITTLYAHMSKYARGIKEGVRVKQGQVIGYIGSSGLASGPHLHYEFRENGVHKNSLKVDLPDAAPIPKNKLARFKQQTETLLSQLETFSENYQIASSQ